MKQTIGILAVVLFIVGGVYLFFTNSNESIIVDNPDETIVPTPTPKEVESESKSEVTEELDTKVNIGPIEVIGSSVSGNDITAYHYGVGDTELLFIGGIHGGYSWNTALVAYELMDYVEANPSAIPRNVRLTVIPVLNPDGLEKVVGTSGRFALSSVPETVVAGIPGRFNANGVDLNRNFDCDWQAEGVWQDRTVSGGDTAFSEPESQAIRDYVNANNPDAVVVWYSAAGGVYASNCGNGVLPETTTLTNVYADASGYTANEEFDFYEITGDMVNWLAKEGVPGISVLLTTQRDTEWSKNKKGVEALLERYSE